MTAEEVDEVSSLETLLKPHKDYVRSDNTISSTTRRDLEYCFKVALKEAVKEDKLVKQLGYTMLSAYTTNPINLAINAPSGEGKTHVLTTVGNLFPKTDVIYIAGMSSKAIFHKNGYIAIRGEEDGEYIEVETELEKLKETVELKKSELIRVKRSDSTDPHTLADLNNEIDKHKESIREIEKNAVKVIDLNHKILVFLDTPSPEIFEALMSLLSHDKYEVEYQFVDSSSRTGLKTRTNVLIGWPSVIFAQAIDYTHHQRYQEIQRRFIITNPRMDVEKYQNAVDLIIEKNCNPDLVYQQKVVSDEEKYLAKEIILNIKDDLLSFSSTISLGKNNILVPFVHILKRLIPTNNTAQDMTFINRLLQHTRLLANIHYKERPCMEITPAFGSDPPLRIPMVTYSDLFESLSLLNNNVGGIRPYVLDWYHDIFLNLYHSKTDPNSKSKNGEIITEQRIAVTTNELTEKSYEVIKKPFASKQILTEFIYPLLNLGYIDSMKSEVDRRASIYFPVIESTSGGGGESSIEYSNLFFLGTKNNVLEDTTDNNANIITTGDKTQIISKIKEVQRYYSENNNMVMFRFANTDTPDSTLALEDENRKVEEIVDKYYSESSIERINITYNKDHCIKSPSSEEYPQTGKNNNNLQDIQANDIKNSTSNPDTSNNLFFEEKKNKLLYSCYYCDSDIDIKSEYESHIVKNHPGRLAYPDMASIEKEGLIPQGKSWEKE